MLNGAGSRSIFDDRASNLCHVLSIVVHINHKRKLNRVRIVRSSNVLGLLGLLGLLDTLGKHRIQCKHTEYDDGQQLTRIVGLSNVQ